MRAFWVVVHRWFGLITAGFLFISGVTGAVISWDHELDDLLNAHLMDVESTGPALSPYALAERIEARDPRVEVAFMPLSIESGHSFSAFVQPKVDPATGELHAVDYNQVFLDPATGAEIGKREWGAVWPVTSENFVSFLYVLHYTLHLPKMFGIDRWGIWLMGGIAIIWTIDCFVGFYLTFPRRLANRAARAPSVERQLARGWWARWKPSWMIKTSGSAYRINFDIHRAFGLWFWIVLFVVAFTAFSLNLYREVFFPVMSTISKVTPTPFDTRTPTAENKPIAPAMTFPQAVEAGRAEAERRGWTEPAGDIFYARSFGIYGVRFFEEGDDHGAAGVGPRILYFDGANGRLLGAHLPWTGTAADIFVQAQFPVHSGRILGLPGRILVSILGIVVAALSVTGVVIWWKNRAARRSRMAAATTGGHRQPQPAPAE